MQDVHHLDILLSEAKNDGKHLTMRGRLVDCHSQACLDDLYTRMEDARRTRDLASTRSDERIYYNGVLRVLRRKIRAVEKELRKKEALTETRQRTTRRTGRSSIRAMQMSGIL
jgi:hypothetical protein